MGKAAMDEDRTSALVELSDRLGHRFQEIERLNQALTHKSFVNETSGPKGAANEVLEFLGDAVLSLAIGHLLLQRLPDAGEGALTKKRSRLVKQAMLAHLSGELGLGEYLLLGKGELHDGGRTKSSLLANAYEALVGAVYLDSGYGGALKMIERHFASYIEEESQSAPAPDYKSLLQEALQGSQKPSPVYRVLGEDGPDHDKRFEASVSVDGEAKGTGWGKSKKKAEQEAARDALEKLSP